MKCLSSVVTVSATDFNLTTLAEVHREFDIRTTADDVYLNRQISRASQAIASHCRRIFARQTYLDIFHTDWRWSGHPTSRIELAHWPVVAIDSVNLNGIELLEGADYTADLASGRLFRHAYWDVGTIEVSYTAGWILPGWPLDSGGGDALPADVEQAAIQTVNTNRQTGRLSYSTRDPFLRSETVEGVGTLTYGTTPIGGSSTGGVSALPQSAKDMLEAYRVPVSL